MPTGYTSDIYEGKEVTGEEFILKCARAFGALVSMREDSLSKEIPKFEPDTYHLKKIESAKIRLENCSKLTPEKAQAEIDDNYEKDVKRYHERLDEVDILKGRYIRLQNEVGLWNPPTKDHIQLKEFALNQIETSIDSDCSTSYLTYPVKHTVKDFLDAKIESAKRDLKYHQEGWDAEVQRTSERNAWVNSLKNSLK